jgi:hypothetical protein
MKINKIEEIIYSQEMRNEYGNSHCIEIIISNNRIKIDPLIFHHISDKFTIQDLKDLSKFFSNVVEELNGPTNPGPDSK